jgi:hypothetical protein
MSIDLSRPLVPSMGQHDPLDGLLTYHELASTAPDSVLDEEMAEMTAICRGKSWVTDDPLGIGGLLTDAYRTAQLMVAGALEGSALLMRLIEAAEVGLGIWARQNPLTRPVRYRLAFRELGLAIGLHAVERLWALVEQEAELGADDPSLPQRIESLTRYVPLTREIEAFWLVPSNQKGTTWMGHLDINRVMLATSLAPEGYLHI